MRHLLPLLLLCPLLAFAAPWVSEQPHAGDFPLHVDGVPAPIVVSQEDYDVVQIAARDLAADLGRVTGREGALHRDTVGLKTPLVLVGTLGKNPLIDELVSRGKLDVTDLKGAWESFLITTLEQPIPGVAQALVIVGSDRRGTAFGVYELSQAIGVSPWYWWADVAPEKKSALYVAAGTRRFGPPSVQYRGIFLNDEDWALQPWAAKTFEPEVGDIGPKTYAKLCELLLRLKANTLWPAMHACTKAFNHYPENKRVADAYAIVMGSSHAEPMLRNNVTEWTAPHAAYDYVNNRDGVHAYWEERVRETSAYENIYTLGMRGIHDSNMVGPKTDAERIATLERIFADQRDLIARHVAPQVGAVPQMFCAYKEVLDLYRQGLKVPDDVTIVWPDDNFGYVRNFATPAERERSGGFGVYYHISYLGRPMAYLWLSTTPPALIWSEMSKAYDHGARRLWIVNVGDLKPAEIGTEFFLQMAWDITRWRHDNLSDFLPEWAAREFGTASAPAIARVMDGYYRLNFERRPEHLQWWLPRQPPRPSPLSDEQIDTRLSEFACLRAESEQLPTALPAEKRDAFEQLVGYPVRGSALANQRYFHGERGNKEAALAADAELRETTRRFNEELAGGKWNHFMTLEPADDDWKSMRIAPWQMPEFAAKPVSAPPAITLDAERFAARTDRTGATWQAVPGLGVTVLPTTMPSVDESRIASDAPQLEYRVVFPAAGEFTLTAHLLPTHPLVAGRGLRFALSLDGDAPQLLIYAGKDGSPDWAQGVLNNSVSVTTKLRVPAAGAHTLKLYGVDAGVVVRSFSLEPSSSTTSAP